MELRLITVPRAVRAKTLKGLLGF